MKLSLFGMLCFVLLSRISCPDLLVWPDGLDLRGVFCISIHQKGWCTNSPHFISSTMANCKNLSRDVEAVKYFCFHFQLRIKLVASKFASSFFYKNLIVSSFRFHIPAPCFLLLAPQKVKCFRILAFSFFLQSASAFTKT